MEITDKATNSANEVVDKVADAASQAAKSLGEKGEQLKKTEQQWMKDCRGYISENPMLSVSIAVAAGFLLSRLVSRT